MKVENIKKKSLVAVQYRMRTGDLCNTLATINLLKLLNYESFRKEF